MFLFLFEKKVLKFVRWRTSVEFVRLWVIFFFKFKYLLVVCVRHEPEGVNCYKHCSVIDMEK